MTKKHIIAIFAYICIIPAIIILISDCLTIISLSLSPKARLLISSRVASLIQGFIFAIVSLFCGIGLLKNKEWGRKLFIYFNIICLASSSIYRFYHHLKYTNLLETIYIFSVLYYLLSFWFFTRKDIKQQFT